MKTNYLKKYRDLEMQVRFQLRIEIDKSSHISEATKTKAIRVNHLDYKEMTVLNDKLIFLDEDGYQFDIMLMTDLEDLINILNSKFK